MKHILYSLAVCTACIMATPAMAEMFVWKDPASDVRVTFPDNWMRQTNIDDDLRLYVLAPGGSDHAGCRLSISTDGRFMDAPAYAQPEVSNFVFTPEELQRVVYARPDTMRVQVDGYRPTAGLGRGAAGYAEITFDKYWMGKPYAMKAMVLGSQFRGQRIIMSCESLVDGWARWQPVMQGIVQSVDFPSGFATEANGYYRRFQDDTRILLPVNRRTDGVSVR